MPDQVTQLMDFLGKVHRLNAPGLIVSRTTGPPLLLAAARQALPEVNASIIEQPLRKELVRSMQQPVLAFLICRSTMPNNTKVALETLIEEGHVMDDANGQWTRIHPHPDWRLVAVADDAISFPLSGQFPYTLAV